MLNVSVPGGPIENWIRSQFNLNKSLSQSEHSYNPQINDAWFQPRKYTIVTATSIFSPPLSPQTWEGMPYSWIASTNRSCTVDALLLLLACNPVICWYHLSHQHIESKLRLTVLQNPSMNPWITILHRISLWWPSQCQR